MENLSVADNPAAEVVDNPSGPIDTAPGTGTTGGQAPGATPSDDLFKGVDPNRLPPEIKQSYNDMLRDYREKTAKIQETIKAEIARSTEPLKTKAEFYDQIAQQEEFVRQWNEYVQKQQSQGTQAEAGDPVLSQMKQQIQEMNQKIQLTELSQVTEAFADAVNEKGEKIHADFDRLNDISIGQLQNGPKAEDFSLLRACVELAKGASPQEKLTNGYKQAKAMHDQIFEAGRKAGMGRVQAKVLNGTNPPSNAAGEVLSTTEKKPKNAREALDMARRGIVVSRD